MKILIAIIIFSAIILIHELGHFLLAKLNGISVTEFSLGMGPRLFSVQKGETRYSVKLLPLGGSSGSSRKVADAMKAEGWEFASHTWGHMNATERSAEDLKTDDKKWKAYVAPILGDTDMVIFAFGADIGDWEGYSSDNPKFQYYKSAGYNYFCNVDSSQYFVQITDQYFRQGRRNLDGYRMYYNPDMLSDLFDVSEVWDSSRPTPVPEM